MSELSSMVRIIARPIGEAPEWVRDAWIGLQIPLSCQDPHTSRCEGVLSESDSFLGRLVGWLLGRPTTFSGYIVNARIAVDLLEAHDPQAAAWWRANTGHLLDGSRDFLFDAPCCEVED